MHRDPTTLPYRSEVRSVKCPYCQAEPGDPCKGVRNPVRRSMHSDRWRAWIEKEKEGGASRRRPIPHPLSCGESIERSECDDQ